MTSRSFSCTWKEWTLRRSERLRAFRQATSPRRFTGSRTFSVASFIRENAVPNDEMKDDLRVRWQSQPPRGGSMSIAEVRAQAQQFQKRIRNRNIREYSAMVLAIVMAIPLAVFFRSFPLIVVA